MPEPSEAELARIHDERAAIFRPAWFGNLAKGRLSLGETFWGGYVGVQLIAMPLWILAMVPAIAAESDGLVPYSLPWVLVLVFYLLQLGWTLAVTRAVLGVAPKARQAGGWRWVAMIVALVIAAQSLALIFTWVTGRL
ncbi:hypothetical protein [Sagittula stellata]|uniref:Uncharacterized protein n=1 Tax=Sagittula stellata (strain ATCC 700073 / DSM 11524 / E-37) TaxID=388399 RepID=A3JYI3_SAGS3|nr:hypothetical protein [Sagittula stellata]EBA09536.1 hypothetical protein SSE37_07008 [Sagittula stellata E-37]